MRTLTILSLLGATYANEYQIQAPFTLTYTHTILGVMGMEIHSPDEDPSVTLPAVYEDTSFYKIVTDTDTWKLVYTGNSEGCTYNGNTGVYTTVATDHIVLQANIGKTAQWADPVHAAFPDDSCDTEILPVTANEVGLDPSAVPIEEVSMCDILSHAQCCSELTGAAFINAQCCSC